MDTTGPFPFLESSDGVDTTPAYSVALKNALLALTSTATATLGPNVTNESAVLPPLITRYGPMVVLQARIKRNVAGTALLLTLPAGVRPGRQVFAHTYNTFMAMSLLQINADGAVSTPFNTGVNEFIITAIYSTLTA